MWHVSDLWRTHLKMFGQQEKLPKVGREALSNLIDKSGLAEKVKAQQRSNTKTNLEKVIYF